MPTGRQASRRNFVPRSNEPTAETGNPSLSPTKNSVNPSANKTANTDVQIRDALIKSGVNAGNLEKVIEVIKEHTENNKTINSVIVKVLIDLTNVDVKFVIDEDLESDVSLAVTEIKRSMREGRLLLNNSSLEIFILAAFDISGNADTIVRVITDVAKYAPEMNVLKKHLALSLYDKHGLELKEMTSREIVDSSKKILASKRSTSPAIPSFIQNQVLVEIANSLRTNDKFVKFSEICISTKNILVDLIKEIPTNFNSPSKVITWIMEQLDKGYSNIDGSSKFMILDYVLSTVNDMPLSGAVKTQLKAILSSGILLDYVTSLVQISKKKLYKAKTRCLNACRSKENFQDL